MCMYGGMIVNDSNGSFYVNYIIFLRCTLLKTHPNNEFTMLIDILKHAEIKLCITSLVIIVIMNLVSILSRNVTHLCYL